MRSPDSAQCRDPVRDDEFDVERLLTVAGMLGETVIPVRRAQLQTKSAYANQSSLNQRRVQVSNLHPQLPREWVIGMAGLDGSIVSLDRIPDVRLKTGWSTKRQDL